ncbi:unnamed protein product [Caenorhabditis angaria]|uniref:Serpentine receptor class gamma n=1 Tax=Caenorhabditis angaria TaxID=860376 RepID=A0A9P1ISY0_9PELO|nr:unnamed protein product [Caenorhabditis angaria]
MEENEQLKIGGSIWITRILNVIEDTYVIILMLFYFLSIVTSFPLFNYFIKINRKKDQKSSIYQITNHLYKITAISQCMITSSLLFIFCYILINLDFPTSVKYVLSFIIICLLGVIYLFNQIVVPIQNLLIFLLAFQRFLLYFYPNSEKYIVPSEKRFNCIIRWLYSIVIFGNSFYIGFLLYTIINRESLDDWVAMHRTEWSSLSSEVYIALDALVIFSSIFYFCILISVRKITKMSSTVMRSRPDKVIIYQTFILIIVKLLFIPISILSFLYKNGYDDSFDAIIKTTGPTEWNNEYSILKSAIYIFLDFLVIFSSSFYIFILVSVRKITRLASNAMKNRPEKVIIYQTLVLIIVKLLCFPIVYHFLEYVLNEDSLGLNATMNAIYFPLFVIDVLTTPIVFQITYIFCNKTNLEVLKKIKFRKANTWKTICCGASLNIVDQSQSELYILSGSSSRT